MAGGGVCPKCSQAGEAWRMRRSLRLCPKCRAQTSVIAGAIFEGTRKPLKLWFIAAWEITGHKYGVNAANVKRILGVGSYKTAWSWLRKLRRAMVRPDRDGLSGIVEVGETYVGGEEEGGRGRYTENKVIVAVAAEVKERGYGRVRLRRIPDVKTATLEEFVTDMGEPGPWSARTPGRDTGTSGCSATSTRSRTSRSQTILLTRSCRGCTASPLCSSGGSLVRIKARSVARTSTTTWTSSCSASTGADRSRGACSFYRLLEQAVQADHTSTHELFKGTGRGVRR